MQAAAEEVKGQPAASTDLDIGGYDNDSDDEREIRELEKGQKEIAFTLNAAGTAQVAQAGNNASTLIICDCLHSQSLVKIMYGNDWQEIGEATSTKTSTDDSASAADREPSSIMKLYAFNAAGPIYFALPEIEKMKDHSAN